MPIERTPMYDDDGSGEVGTVVNSDWKMELYDQIDAVLGPINATNATTSITNITAAGSNIATNPGQIRYLNVTAAAVGPVTITSVAPGNIGDILIIQNLSNYVVDIPYGTGNGSLLNRVTSAPARLATLGTATYIYHAANVFWYMLSHEQGGPITAPFSAANFTGDAAAWTVNAGNITTLAYVLRGKELSVYVAIGGSTLAGTVNFLSINNAAYGGYVSALSTDCFTMLYEGGTNSVGRMLCGPAWSTTAKMQFQKLNGQMVAGTCYVECVAVLSVS